MATTRNRKQAVTAAVNSNSTVVANSARAAVGSNTPIKAVLAADKNKRVRRSSPGITYVSPKPEVVYKKDEPKVIHVTEARPPASSPQIQTINAVTKSKTNIDQQEFGKSLDIHLKYLELGDKLIQSKLHKNLLYRVTTSKRSMGILFATFCVCLTISVILSM